MSSSLPGEPQVSVAIVAISSARCTAACLDAIEAQEGAAEFETLVSYDPAFEGYDELAIRYPWVRFVRPAEGATPGQIASLAMRDARGEYILMTEDHCIPAPNWVAEMAGAYREGMAAVGGRVEAFPGGGPFDVAFYLVDFFKYGNPLQSGESETVTIANVLYRKSYLGQIEEVWRDGFLEPEVNAALRARFGKLQLHAPSETRMNRRVSLYDGCRERYAFGRLFGAARVQHISWAMRFFFVLTSPLLPVILFARMLRRALLSAERFRGFCYALVPLVAMLVFWSWGEWLGYVTGTRPADISVAPERGG